MPSNQSDLDMLKKALGDGSYGPDELTQQLVHSGYTPSDASALMKQAGSELAGPPHGGASDTFLGESGLGAMGNILQQGYHAATTQPMKQLPGDLLNTLRQAYQGQAAETGQELGAAKDALGSGNVAGALAHFIGGAPVVGHPLLHGAYNLTHGNASGLAGDIVSLLGLGAGGALGDGGKVSDALQGIGSNVYRGVAKYPESMSLQDMDKATGLGMGNNIPATRAGLAKLGNVKASDTVLGGLEDQLQPFVTGQKGRQALPMNTILQPALDHALEMAQDTTPGGQKYLDDFIKEVDGWHQANQSGVNMQQGQAAKRTMYKAIADNQYADNSSALPTAAKRAKEELARGLKNAQNEVEPGMQPLNDQMHSGIQLHDALTKVLKQAPVTGRDGLLWALGFGLDNAATTMGHPMMGKVGLAALAARQAMHVPAVATRVALALGHSPEVLGALGGVARAGATGGALSRPLTYNDLQNLGEQQPQDSQAAPSNK